MDAVDAVLPLQVVMTSYDLVLAGANKVLSCGNYICIQMPLQIVNAYWRAQMSLLTLPYRCVHRLLTTLRNAIAGLVYPPIHATTQQILQEFLRKENSERDGLMKSIEEIREHSLATVEKIEAFNLELQRCKSTVDQWKCETEKKAKRKTSFAKEEKKLLRVVITVLKHIRRLKGSKVVLDEKFKHTLEDLVNFSRSLSQKREELNESADGSPGSINGNLKSAYNRLQKQADLLKEFTEKRRKVFCRVSHTPWRGSCEFNTSTPKHALVTDTELVSIGMETLQSIVCVLNAENVVLKKRLKLTNDQLADVNQTSKCLAAKVSEMEEQLDRVKNLLKSTEAERDDMCFKLRALNEIIEEQEGLLNESSHENSMDSLYLTARDTLLDDPHVACALSFDSGLESFESFTINNEKYTLV